MAVLSPIDLLSFSPEEQKILRCLTKQQRQAPPDIAAQTGLPLTAVELTLAGLVKAGKIVEQLHGEERTYSARFQFKNRKVRNMPAQILNMYERSTENLLADIPLFSSLSAEGLAELQALSSKRDLVPEEVLFWQGNKLEFVGIVQNGLLKLTEIQGRGASQPGDYLRRTDWMGLEETMGGFLTQATCTAVTESTILFWSTTTFYHFIHQHPPLLMQINHTLSQKLRDCETTKKKGEGKLWVIDGIGPHVGATTVAASLATIAQKNLNGDGHPHVLFWPHPKETEKFASKKHSEKKVVSLAQIKKHDAGFDMLVGLEANNYPVNVRLDMLLTTLLRQYEYIICDAGDDEEDFLLHLRGNAHTIITLAAAEQEIQAGWERWQRIRPFAPPGQKKVLALNKAQSQGIQVDPNFQLVIPQDAQGVSHIWPSETVKTGTSDNAFIRAIEEVYRRLSLTHSLAIFVPSTLDVEQTVDNSHQVNTALSFFGDLFGGATSSDAEGVWRSDDVGLVTEQVTVVRTFVSKKALNSNLDHVLDFASQLKKEMKQEAVAVSVDNQMILV